MFTNYLRKALYLLLLVAWSASLWAVMASPHPFKALQPDGTQVTLRVHGDEFLHWQTDEAGYAVVKDAQGRYVYAEADANGRLQPTALVVGQSAPVGLQKGIRPHISPQGAQAAGESITRVSAQENGVQRVPPTGAVKNLEIMIRFSDHASRALPSQADVDTLFNAVGGDPTLAPTGSIRDLYLENSYNQLTLNTTVTAWITLSHTEAYYADGQSGSQKLWEGLIEALNYLDSNHIITFADFDQDHDGSIDAIGFIHSGYAAEWNADPNRIWSHRWSIQPAWVSSDGVSVSAYHIESALWGTSGANIGHIGVSAHEIGHFFGLPDLYDTDYSSRGLGSWGIMANSWGVDGTQQHPPHFSAWSKIFLGWVTPTVLTAAGTYTANQVETHAQIYKVTQGYPSGEYLLIENRQPVGFENNLPQGGLAVWHVDEDKSGNNQEGFPGQTGWPANGNHYQIALLAADGNYDLENDNNGGDAGDMWHSGSALAQMDDTTVPGLFGYQGGNVVNPGNTLCNVTASGAQISFGFNNCSGSSTPAGPLDVDGDGEYDALTDGLLVIRYLFGFRGNTLIADAVDAVNCSRCTAADIETYLATMTP